MTMESSNIEIDSSGLEKSISIPQLCFNTTTLFEVSRETLDVPHVCYPAVPEVVSISKTDPTHPFTFSSNQKLYICLIVGFGYTNSTLSSSLPGGAAPYIVDYFHVTNNLRQILPQTAYLLGCVVGPLLLTPLTEQWGRKRILLLANILFLGASIGCALSPTFDILVVFRAFTGFAAAVPLTVIGGVYADLFDDARSRGKATAAYTILGAVATVCGPTLFAFVSIPSWRWSFWLTCMSSGLNLLGLIFIPETYMSQILRLKAQSMRCSLHCKACVAPIEVDNRRLLAIWAGATTRPCRFFFGEAVVFFSSLYASLVYGILFLLFAAYSYIFQDIYGMSYSISGLAFLPMGAGVLFAYVPVALWDNYFTKRLHTASSMRSTIEFRRLPLACAGGVLQVLSMFWLAWTSSENIHWIVPMLSGFPFAMSLMLILVSIFSYLTDAYGSYSASAQGAASCVRSIWGALLPLAARSMYTKLGVAWGTSILGFAAIAMLPIPFIFIVNGTRIRAKSQFCTELLERKVGIIDAPL